MKKGIFIVIIVLLFTACTKEKVYYEFGLPTKSSSIDYQDVISSSNSNTLVKLESEQLSVCIYKGNELECFKNNNYDIENEHLQNVFGTDNCNIFDSLTWCFGFAGTNAFQCIANSDGDIACGDMICKDENCEKVESGLNCEIYTDGKVKCE